MAKLGVNIDHVATVREARKISEPDPVEAARLCEAAGCDSIVCHLREDRRHINDIDLQRLRKAVKTRLNLEMAIAADIVDIACRVHPEQATIVPERREEITTEGGLDVANNERSVERAVRKLKKRGIAVSLFINPSKKQIEASLGVGAGIVEFHTGEYANAGTPAARKRELKKLEVSTSYALKLGLEVNAGHGLNYDNAGEIALIKGMNELNIGHSIISRAIFVGIYKAVEEMLELVK